MPLIINNVDWQKDLLVKLQAPYIKETLNSTQFTPYISGSYNDPIVMITRGKGEGLEIPFPLNQVTDANISTQLGAQLSGTGDYLNAVTENLRIGVFDFSIKALEPRVEEIQSKINVVQRMREDLQVKAAWAHNMRIVKTFGMCFNYNWFAENSLNPNDFYHFSFDDLIGFILSSRIDVVGGICSDRIVFGNGVPITANNTVAQHLEAMAAAAQDPLNPSQAPTVDHLKMVKDLAKTGGRGTTYGTRMPIKPYREMTVQGLPANQYLLFGAPAFFNKLAKDSDYKDQMTRGTVESAAMQPSIFAGGDYQGTLRGARLVEIPEFESYVFVHSGHTYAYSALLGGGAIGYGYSFIELETEVRNAGKERELFHLEVSGMKPLKFPWKIDSKKLGRNANPIRAEHGMVHSFTLLK